MRSVAEIKAELSKCESALSAAKTEAESKKVSINGSYGKFGSKWSALR